MRPQAQPRPVGVKLLLAHMAPHPSRPTAPEPDPKRVAMLRRTESRLWTPIFVVKDGDRYLVLDGMRRVEEARRRGEKHIRCVIGEPGKPLVHQYQALGLPITMRTLSVWVRSATAEMLEKVRRPWRRATT
jgi:hypothetical protein